MNPRIIFKFKDCKLQFYKKKTKVALLFQCESSQACQSLAPLVETKTKKINSFKIIVGFFFTPPLFLAPHHYSSPHHIYNSLLRMRAIHGLKRTVMITAMKAEKRAET